MPEHAPQAPKLTQLGSHYSPLRYPGGKRPLLRHARAWLRSASPQRLVEAFAGGASVGLTALCEDLVEELVLIELDPELAHFWKTVFSPNGEALAAAVLTVPTPEDARALLAAPPATESVDRALRLLVLNRMRRSGILAEGAGLIGGNGKTKPKDERYNPATLAERIRLLSARRDRVSVIRGNALEELPRYLACADTAFYLDPPYSLPGGPAKRLYRYWQLQHRRLFALVEQMAGDVLVSHQDHPTVRRLARASGLQLTQVTINTAHGPTAELLMARELTWLTENELPATVLTLLELGRLTGNALSLLPTFVAVAEDLHLTRAAARLGVNKSSVSRRLGELERVLGARLFARGTQTVQLTSDGEAMYAAVRAPLEALGVALGQTPGR